MTRGPKKHMKRLNAPSHWMLNKLGGIFVSPSQPMTTCWHEALSASPWDEGLKLYGGSKARPTYQQRSACLFQGCKMSLVLRIARELDRYVQAPKPSPGPHKQRECLPLVLILRNRLKCVLQLAHSSPQAGSTGSDHHLRAMQAMDLLTAQPEQT